MKEETIRDIERLNCLFLTAGSILVILLTRDFRSFLSYALACAIMVLNFRLLRHIILKGFSPHKPSRKLLIFGLSAKFLGLFLAVSLVLIFGEIDLTYFVLGLTSFFLSVVLSQIPPRLRFSKGGDGDGA